MKALNNIKASPDKRFFVGEYGFAYIIYILGLSKKTRSTFLLSYR